MTPIVEQAMPSGSLDTEHRHEYHIRQLGTRSVTLFPSRAQVVREVKGIPLKVGINQVTFIGLTPNLDEHSVKIEGVGTATISDTAVELLPNREVFQDVYPDSDSEDSDTPSDDGDKDIQSVPGIEGLRAVREKMTQLRTEQAYATELINSADSRLEFLDSYGWSMVEAAKSSLMVDIERVIATYKAERGSLFEDDIRGKSKLRDLQGKLAQLKKEEDRLLELTRKGFHKAEKVNKKAAKVKGREKEEHQRKKQRIKDEKDHIRKERERFWPQSVYIVKVNLEVEVPTPTSSRRNSTPDHDTASTSPIELAEAHPAGLRTFPCDLTLSYVTSSAYWSPSYDLALSTTTNTGSLCFDARLTNQTSETWQNCKIILTTSQTSFSNLDEAVPTLGPWKVGLAGGNSLHKGDIIHSREEQAHKEKLSHASNSRNFHPISKINRARSIAARKRSEHSEEMDFFPMDLTSSQANLVTFQESSFEESGLNATYDLPGLKCLPSSSTISKQRVARVTFTEVEFSYTVVAKYNPAAYLQVKVQNTSKLTLLKGPVGLTLDGGFLGRSSLSRCGPGSLFRLSLGVDPAIQVTYPKPEIKHGQLGVFSKDNSTVYTRTMTLHNTRSDPKSKAVRLVALDQVPISGDERLHVVILQPKELATDDSKMPVGKEDVEPASDNTWGKAVAKMKEGGQIAWDVTVNAGCTAKLILQYQCVYPTGESTINL